MVDGKISEVEEAITHPGVFPVDDPDGRSVVDKVRVQQIVVTEHGPLGPKRPLDVEGDRPGALVGRRQLAAVPGGDQRVRLHHAER